MQGNRVLVVSCALGLSCLWAIASLCSFPGVLFGAEPRVVYRAFNMSFVLSFSLAAFAYISVAFLCSRRVVVGVSNVAFCILTTGLVLAQCFDFGRNSSVAFLVGALCGLGLSVSLSFSLVLLSWLPERRAIMTQGWQMLFGVTVFAVGASYFRDLFGIVSVFASLVAWGSMLVFLRKSSSAQVDVFPVRAPLRSIEALSPGMRSANKMFVPFAGFVLVSFIFGVVEVVAMGAAGSPNGAIASFWGAPVGAALFLLWLRHSSHRDYRQSLKVMFFAFATAFVVPVFDVTVFMMSAGIAASQLLIVSIMIDEFSSDRRIALALIAFSFAIAKGALLVGLYVPGWFGVRSHEAYYQSASLPLFIVYLIFVAILVLGKEGVVGRITIWLRSLFTCRKSKNKNNTEARLDPLFSGMDDIDKKCQAVAYECKLTKRESEVLNYLARGRNTAYVSEQLYLSRNTVKGYTKSLYAKLGVHSHQELIDVMEAAKDCMPIDAAKGAIRPR